MNIELMEVDELQHRYKLLKANYDTLQHRYNVLNEKLLKTSSFLETHYWQAFLEQDNFAVEVLNFEGVVLDMNKEAERIFDCKKEEFIPIKLPLLQSPQCPEEVKEAFKLRIPVTTIFPYQVLTPVETLGRSVDKKEKQPYYRNLCFRAFPVKNSQGEPICYIAVVTLDTEYLKLKNELLAARKIINDSNLHTRMLLDSLDEAVIYVSSDLRIIDVNKKYENMLNCDRVTIRVFQQSLKEQPVVTTEMEEAIKRGEVYQTNFWFLPCLSNPLKGTIVERNTPGSVYLQYRGLPIVDEENDCIGYLGLFSDRTSEQLMLEELKLAKEKADTANKMKSTFLANMSHEIRTPLNSIVGFSDLLAEMMEECPEAKEYNEMIRDNNALLLRLVNDVLDFAKLETGSMQFIKEEFSFSDMMREVYVALKPKAIRHQHQLSFIESDEHYIVQLDKVRVMQVIINFLNNAINYTPDGGKLTMRAYRYKNGMKIEVVDNGIGIAPENKDKVFKRFEKIDSFAQGTGLGLSISKVITELQGGEIGFFSELGKGSTFWAWFPTPTVSVAVSLL